MGVIINHCSHKESQNKVQLNLLTTLLSESLTDVLPKKSTSPYSLSNIWII